ncbi:class I SAM-dependent methyltransferase [Pseudohoeflea suaedae]|uniref:Class I SAM-dependent methyltransferase n=1 Tax=Pseudohoeflea suaedae TaxID=877384 RepID=A0A4R5PNT8_9HYPH|nr:cyclopropane-fatty-acyl-phospholipid synthase family protein [Pseudohoeflea suaedae]TDH38706.1 class I SAM-dependent methyltransferase [Pseudohoeflea suaedae]
MSLLDPILHRAIKAGRLKVTKTDGSRVQFGGHEPGPDAAIRFMEPGVERQILFNPELGGPEAYIDDKLVIEEGTLHDVIRIFMINRDRMNQSPFQRFWQEVAHRFRFIQQYNSAGRARKNVAVHYDIGEEIYRLFLDRDLQYSCAYFPTGAETLEDAQTLKKRHIAAKLQIEDGQRILDIGCGWGGMGLYLAHLADVEVVGVTLSEHQLQVAQRRAEILGVADRVKFELLDYRAVTGKFDRIVSVGMLEHVGAGYLAEYFTTVRERLADDGVALIHAISSIAPPGGSMPFLHKYIFPGGYTPALSETMTAVENANLWLLDCEILRQHYGYTLAHWSKRFADNRDAAVRIMGERFCKMWEFYLAMCEASFMDGTSHVFQLQLGNKRDAVPITRNYIETEEMRLASLEAGFLERVVGSAQMALGK